MSAVAAPYGFKSVNILGHRPFVAGTQLVKIASGLASNIFYGDPVKMLSSGTIDKETGTTSVTTAAFLGIFYGCTYTDPGLNYKVFRQFWPTGTVAADAFAYVCTDPWAVFSAQADGALAQTTLGNNVAMVQTAGSTATGNSKIALSASSAATTNTLPFKIVGFVEGGGSSIGDAFTDVHVILNAGMHHYLSALGI